MSAVEGPLTGVRVLDFTRAVAGPHATSMLAYLGAEVIRVESRTRPDTSRMNRGLESDLNRGHLFVLMNVNKCSIGLNPAKPEGHALVMRLAERADIVVDNLRGGVMDRLGLTYEAFRAANERIIMLSAPTAGVGGPAGRYAGVAASFAALSGILDQTGFADGPPCFISELYGDPSNAGAITFALLAALEARERTGKGQFIDFSHAENLAGYLAPQYLDWCNNGRLAQRIGNADPVFAPHGVYPCKGEDPWLSIAITTDAEWRACVEVLGLHESCSDERFGDGFGRAKHQAELDACIEQATRAWDKDTLAERLQAAGVPAAPVWSWAELASGPQIAERNQLRTVEHPLAGGVFIVAPPWVTDGFPIEAHSVGPPLGGDNDYVFRELLHLSDEEIGRLEDEGVIEPP